MTGTDASGPSMNPTSMNPTSPEPDPASAIEEEIQRDEDAPFICPGCHAVNAEEHASWCPDASIQRAREDERRRRDYEPDDDDIDGHEEDGIPW